MLNLRNIEKEYDAQPLLKNVSFKVGLDETICLLGPSGGGKSTLLRIIAGLEAPDSGEVFWKDKNITHTPAHLRGFGLMFQDYALFPHLNVFENIAFGLRIKQFVEEEINARVTELLEMVNLLGVRERSVTDLSGGEKQRVAFARALAPRPKLLMLDEPMGSLDRTLRGQLMKELRELLQETDVPVIYVTHDQEEAFAIADRILILHNGRIIQSGSPRELYSQPENDWVASFFGFNNHLDGRIVSSDPMMAETEIGDFIFECSKHTFGENEMVRLVILPTALRVGSDNENRNNLSGEVIECSFRGNNYLVRFLLVGGKELSFQADTSLTVGTHIEFSIDPEYVLCFKRAGN